MDNGYWVIGIRAMVDALSSLPTAKQVDWS